MASSGPVVGSEVILFQDGELAELHLSVPRKWGIPPSSVQLRCVAASRELVVLGTNMGMIIVHQLQNGTTEKVPLEGPLKKTAITAMQLFPDLHNRLAVGRQSGLINILQVVTDEKERKCSCLRKLHKADVTCVEWDTRGSMLFSADSSGKVMGTRIDMKEGKHHPWLVYDCEASVVQLSFSSMMLLISSELRSVVCHVYPDMTHDSPPRVGRKERKPGTFGGCMVTENSNTTCYVARPGIRVWHADKTGKVLSTMKLKESLDSGTPTIKLPGKRKEDESSNLVDVQLQQLLLFGKRFLVGWFGGQLWLIERHGGILAGVTAGVGNILDVCVCQRWLYVLREPPYAHQLAVVRLALDPSVVPRGEQSPSSRSILAEARLTTTLAVQAESLSAASSCCSSIEDIPTQARPHSEDVSENKESSERVVSPVISIHQPPADSDSSQPTEDHFPAVLPALPSSAPPITLSSHSPDSTSGSSEPNPAANLASEPTDTLSHEDSARQSPAAADFIPLDREERSSVPADNEDGKPSSKTLGSPVTAGSVSTSQPALASSLPVSGQGAGKMPERLKSIMLIKSEGDDDLLVKPKRAVKKKKKGVGDGLPSKALSKGESATDLRDSPLLDGGVVSPSLSPLPRSSSPSTGTVVNTAGAATRDGVLPEISKPATDPRPKQSPIVPLPSLVGIEADTVNYPSDSEHRVEPTGRISPLLRDSPQCAEEDVKKDVTASEGEVQGDCNTFADLPVDGLSGVEEQAQEAYVDGELVAVEPSGAGEEHSSPDVQLAAQKTGPVTSSMPDSVERDQLRAGSTNFEADPDALNVASALTDDDEPNELFGNESSRLVAVEEHPLAASSDDDSMQGVSQATADTLTEPTAGSDRDVRITSIYDMVSRSSSFTESTSNELAAGQQREVFVPDGPSATRASIPGHDQLMDSWAQWPSPSRNALASVTSSPSLVCVTSSSTHVWVVDSKDNVFVSSLSSPIWQPVRGRMRQVSSSPSGEVVWGRSKSGSLYYRFGIDLKKRPQGTDWKKMDFKVKAIAADNRRCWVLDQDGYVMLRRTVSGACPTGQSWVKLDLRPDFQSIAAGHDVLWAITSASALLARVGISRHSPSGTGWEQVGRTKVQYVSLGRKNYGWCVNKKGVSCFVANVTMQTPSGDERWWQVAMGQVLHGSTFMESLLSWPFAKRSDPLLMVSACENAIYAISSSSVIHSCSGSMEGSLYRPASPLGTAQSMTWLCVAANAVFDGDSRIWALRPNGELFCFQRGKRPDPVDPPAGRHQLQWLSVSSEAVWGLTTEGVILERMGISRYCPLGTNWEMVSVEVLGGAKVVDIACGIYWVWAVDDKGFVWLRHGPLAVLKDGWRRIEPFSWTVRFVKVAIGADWLVWALDSNGAAYVRKNITAECPAGTEWEHVPGLSCTELSIGSNTGISNKTIWARCANGDVASRNNVSPRDPVGDYWKRIPGNFAHISATPDNELWVIDQKQRLFVRETSVFLSRVVKADDSSLEGWDVIS